MTPLLDTSLWIVFTRSRSPATLKQFIAPHVLVSFDADFETIAAVSALRVKRLKRPGAQH